MLRMLVLVLCGTAYANPEITVDLPGGATMEFVWIEPGTFTMGTTEEQERGLLNDGVLLNWTKDEQPAHQVTISQGFYLGRFEITQGQWEAVMRTRPWSPWMGAGGYVREGSRKPASFVSWTGVQDFILVLNEATNDAIYRLPTEAEWEYACRAGTTTFWSFGDNEQQLRDHVWFSANAYGEEWYAHEVGTKLPNPWGLFDMHGNVSELCQDWHGPYSGESLVDPTGPPGPAALSPDRVIRGGNYTADGIATGSAYRNGIGQDLVSYFFGARLLKTAPPSTVVTPQTWGGVKSGK
jgi:formylglycine-generating enzyme required for sulfatase activity